MFKGKNAEINILLTALLLLSALIGGLHHRALNAQQATATNQSPSPVNQEKTKAANLNPLADSPPEELFNYLQPLIISNSVEKIIKVLTGVPAQAVSSVLKKILDIKEANLNRDDRIAIILGLAVQYAKQEEQYSILDLIIAPQYLYLRDGTPILLVAASTDYPHVISIIKKWYADRVAKQEDYADLIEQLESRALALAVQENKLEELQILMRNGVVVDGDRMGELLVDAVKKKTSCDIIKFLLENGADINYVAKGHTALLWAIKNHDLKAVICLVKHGADVNRIGDNAVGNPRQVAGEAIEKALASAKKGKKTKKNGKIQSPSKSQIADQDNAVKIESYLIKHGADH